ncbi:alpha-ribazole phosphatase family protein [Puia dinghuensis]|uniref:Phosphoglycerate mutase n=1 Tax=Puia dinghuensis TaxID=1792502 RepID=A0A8J2UEU4_9BACT|nr:alpha-ribazole phosphatase family protein [Puia dinghuensis]GGB08042.1 phosphoglycerate mutase [Puia dinghuensis]
MRDIYLIRHTTPDVAKGICYGQTDLGVTSSFEEETEVIRGCLPTTVSTVYSSPLQRCSLLAERLFPGGQLLLREHLMEIDCGQWEMKAWDQLPKEEVDPWMADFVNIRIPGGESYLDLHGRVGRCWEEIVAAARVLPGGPEAGAGGRSGAIAVVAHGGVIRSILAGMTGTPLIDSFKAFSLHYGCVIRVRREEDGLVHTILSNPAPAEKEQHKPSSFYTRSSL